MNNKNNDSIKKQNNGAIIPIVVSQCVTYLRENGTIHILVIILTLVIYTLSYIIKAC